MAPGRTRESRLSRWRRVEARRAKVLECVGGGRRAAGRGVPCGDPAGSVAFGHRDPDVRAQPLGFSLGGEPRAGVGDLDAARDLELVSSERDDAHRHARCERLLGRARATVGDRADRAREQRRVWDEALDAGVRRDAPVELAAGIVATTSTSSSASASSVAGRDVRRPGTPMRC